MDELQEIPEQQLKTQNDYGRMGGLLAGNLGDAQYCTKYSKNSRSKCQNRKCMHELKPGEVVVGRRRPSKDGHSKKVQWFHPTCLFQTFPTMRKSSKTVKSVKDLQGFEDLKPADQRDISLQLDSALAGPDEEGASDVERADESADELVGDHVVVGVIAEEQEASESSEPVYGLATGAEIYHVLEDALVVVDEDDASRACEVLEPAAVVELAIITELDLVLQGGFDGGEEEGFSVEMDGFWHNLHDGMDEEHALPLGEERTVAIVEPDEFENRVVAEENGMLIVRAFTVSRLSPVLHCAKRHRSITPTDSCERTKRRAQTSLLLRPLFLV